MINLLEGKKWEEWEATITEQKTKAKNKYNKIYMHTIIICAHRYL